MAQQCQVCDEGKSKYKCPQCSIQYCSIACFRGHKQMYEGNEASLCDLVLNNKEKEEERGIPEGAFEDDKEEPEIIKTDYVEDESLRLSPQELEKLASNPDLLKMLKDPEIRHKILEIDNSRMRLNLLQQALLNENFMNFADEALKTVGKLNKEK